MSRIISYSGSQGTGKSTSAHSKYIDLKLGFSMRPEPQPSVFVLADLEAFCPYPINKQGSERAQKWLFANQIREEMKALERFDILVTDRTVVDVIAYTYVLGFESLAQGMLTYAEAHMQQYSEIYFKKILHNPYLVHDGIRDADDGAFRMKVEVAMLTFYAGLTDPGIFQGKIFYV